MGAQLQRWPVAVEQWVIGADRQPGVQKREMGLLFSEQRHFAACEVVANDCKYKLQHLTGGQMMSISNMVRTTCHSKDLLEKKKKILPL